MWMQVSAMRDEVRAAITANVRERLDAFWKAGLRGADFFISAIGPATAAFSRYTRVETLGGEAVTVSTLLQWVQEEVADYALGRVFTRGAATSERGRGPRRRCGRRDTLLRALALDLRRRLARRSRGYVASGA